MVEIHLSDTTQLPLYKQIGEQVKQLIATDRLRSGEHMPTVRQLSLSLHVNPATVAKAYQELEREGILGTQRRRGTIVLGSADDPRGSALRQSRLSNVVDRNILEALSLGYNPEELEAAFSLHLARWREERQAKEPSRRRRDRLDARNTILIVGSHDLALSLLISRLKHKNPEISVQVTCAGSLGGLIALQEGRADLAGVHLLDEETGEYNYQYVKHILPGMEVAIVHLAYRIQGLMFARGNPKQVRGLEDLKRSDITFINRQKGSGTRVSLDYRLRELGIAAHDVKGYDREMDTHLAVAMGIARGEADVGLGIEAAAHACDIDFLPIAKERFDLVIPAENYHRRQLSLLLAIIESGEFRKVVTEMGGYDTSQTGTTTFVK